MESALVRRFPFWLSRGGRVGPFFLFPLSPSSLGKRRGEEFQLDFLLFSSLFAKPLSQEVHSP